MNKLEAVARAICKAEGNDPDELCPVMKDVDGMLTRIGDRAMYLDWKPIAQAAIEAMEEWQPIDTAPNDGTEILIKYKKHTIPETTDGRFYRLSEGYGETEVEQVAVASFVEHGIDGLNWQVNSFPIPFYVLATHWQPLPQPPKER